MPPALSEAGTLPGHPYNLTEPVPQTVGRALHDDAIGPASAHKKARPKRDWGRAEEETGQVGESHQR